MKLSRWPSPLRSPLKATSLPAASRSTRKDRMYQQPDVRAALGKFAEHRIDQKRHVVVEHVEHRRAVRRIGHHADLRHAGRPFLKKRPRLFGDPGELVGPVMFEILARRTRVQIGQEVPRDVGPQRSERRRGGGDQVPFGIFRSRAGNALYGHYLPPFGGAARRVAGILRARRAHSLLQPSIMRDLSTVGRQPHDVTHCRKEDPMTRRI